MLFKLVKKDVGITFVKQSIFRVMFGLFTSHQLSFFTSFSELYSGINVRELCIQKKLLVLFADLSSSIYNGEGNRLDFNDFYVRHVRNVRISPG